MTEGFNTTAFLELRAKSVFLAKEKPKKPRKAVIDGTTNVELFELLRELKKYNSSKRRSYSLPNFYTKSLICYVRNYYQLTKADLKQVHGMGKTSVDKYGSEIIEVIREYCEENDIETSMDHEIFENQIKT